MDASGGVFVGQILASVVAAFSQVVSSVFVERHKSKMNVAELGREVDRLSQEMLLTRDAVSRSATEAALAHQRAQFLEYLVGQLAESGAFQRSGDVVVVQRSTPIDVREDAIRRVVVHANDTVSWLSKPAPQSAPLSPAESESIPPTLASEFLSGLSEEIASRRAKGRGRQ